MQKLTFRECLDSKKAIDKKSNYYSDQLNSFPVKKSGLVSDIYRNSPEYIEANKQFNFWFKQLQDINKYINKNYKKENRELILKYRFRNVKN